MARVKHVLVFWLLALKHPFHLLQRVVHQVGVQDVPGLVGVGVDHPVHLGCVHHVDLGLIRAVVVRTVTKLEQRGDYVVRPCKSLFEGDVVGLLVCKFHFSFVDMLELVDQVLLWAIGRL